ncbi:mavicyanin-like [Silene latifolia]|uniref:mavicyanin-like n=1 Tax=Silene latifolia TaxID=37657 RepID=UPI003D787BE2
MAVCAMIVRFSMAETYVVGDPKGAWDERTKMQEWVKPIKFVAGDKLVFLYSKSHDVLEVSKSDYDACETSNAIVSDNSGKTVVPLKKPGKRYFICGVPGHCKMGMKLEVNVIPSTISAIATSPVTLPGMPPSTMPGSPLTGPSESPLSLPPAQPSSADLGSNVNVFLMFFVSAFVVLAF